MTTSERDAFLAERRLGIGGSDVAALLGVDPRKTAYQLWREKVGLPLDDAGKPAARRRGHFLEPAVLRAYAELVRPDEIVPAVAHQVEGWRRGNQDARAVMADGTKRVVEVKTVTRAVHRSEWGQPWSDEVPDRALCQGLWYGALDGANIIDFAVLVVPDDPDEVIGLQADQIVEIATLHIYQAQRRPDLERWIVERAREFWTRNVLGRVQPEITVEDAALAWPTHVAGKTLPADPIVDMLVEYDALKGAEARRRELRDRIMHYAQDCEALTLGGSPVVTMRRQERAAYEVPASSMRVMRFTKWWARNAPATTQSNPPTTETEP